ncbi:SMC5-SMC6 complex localization factor protein 2 isoform X2 [Parambassis ranga]|uniref:SMC5-SMC6 complex localization factor protein 2 isoform X2 n=1 Tax=Parambassis ranga TaxID=210632 RepID=A0A6P7JVQ1_9TELE|nr:SMC5-SMC6 complex localization factor protein 2-like isoform X2 [Parambassis ranga]
MRKITENQGTPRINGYHFPPGSKVKDLQQQSLPHFPSFHQETPMKPSQVPNLLSHPASRRMLPLQTSDLHYNERSDSPQHRTHVPVPLHLPGLVPGSQTNISPLVSRTHPISNSRQHFFQSPGFYSSVGNIGSSIFKPQPTVRDRPGPPQQSGQPRPGTFSSSTFSPLSPTYSNTSANKLQPSTPSVVLSDHAPRFPINTDQKAVSRVTPVNSGSKNETAHRQASHKTQPIDGSNCVTTVQLHRLPIGLMNPALKTKSSQEVGGSSSTHRVVIPQQSQQHERTPPREKHIPVDLNSSSQKRPRESAPFDENAKKLCRHGTNSGKTQATEPTAGNLAVTSSFPQRSSHESSDLELSPKITGHLCGQSTCSEPSSTAPTKSCHVSPLSKDSSGGLPLMGVKQALINLSESNVVKLKMLKPNEEKKRKGTEEGSKRDKSSTLLTSEIPQKDRRSLPHTGINNCNVGHAAGSTSVSAVKTQRRGDHTEVSRKLDSSASKSTSKPNSGSLGCRPVERNTTSGLRKPAVIPDDIDMLFTPDPITYVISTGNNKTKPMINREAGGLASSVKSVPSAPTDSTITPTGSSCHKAKNSSVTGSCQTVSSSEHNPQSIPPSVTVKHVQHKTLTSRPKDKELADKPLLSTSSTAASGKPPTASHSLSLPLERQTKEKSIKQVNEEDPIDVELDLDLSFGIDMDLTHSSNGSEADELISLQEMMECVLKPPETPEKGAFSEPSTPGHRSSRPKSQPLASTSKSGIYKNNLDQILKDISADKKAEDTVAQLLTACKEDLLRISEYEETQQNQEEEISTEQQEFLQRYSLMSSAIREVPPGEVVFNLDRFGQIFDQKTLALRKCLVNPQGTAQKTLLWSSPAQLKLHLYIGLFQEAYNSLPCPTPVTRFLFKMMSVHIERIVSEKILQALCDIACSAAYHIVEKGSQHFKVWVPSLADVTLVLMNMGVPFVTLFPFEDLQPPFTEGDLLDHVYIKSESPSSNTVSVPFPEHNCSNILKYLSYCMSLCPRAYSDEELLLLDTVVSRLGLDMRLTLQNSKDLYPILCKIVNNFRDWDSVLPRICLALTNLTDDHHNMCLLVQLMPINTRGKQLRRHLSLSMINRLLDGSCTYRPTQTEFQLSELRPYISRMRPSSILRGMLSSSSKTEKEKEEDAAILDQQSYYMCYSLLTLLNEATNFQFFPANQKKQLLLLSNKLEAHVKCDIRESEKCLYRTKVKDFVARIYTKWRMLLQRTKPLNGKLCDYWQPMDTLISSEETASVTLS